MAESAGSPFVRTVARQIIEGLFRDQPQWKTRDLVERVVKSHLERGGAPLETNPTPTIRRALEDLERDGSVDSPGHGWWRWTGSSLDGPIPEEQATDTTAVDDVIDGLNPIIQPDKEIGAGSECVYLYFNPNDRRLAELEGRDVWECKIGRTSSRDASQRILGQGIRTALSRLPTVGLVLRVEDSAALESALHSSLRLVGAEVPDSPGNEWFITSPARVQAWYESFRNALAAIETSSAESASKSS